MVLYNVTWSADNNLTKGKGRLHNGEHVFGFSVLCDSSSSAHRCLIWYFDHFFSKVNKHDLSLDDGVIRMNRITVDSRGFIAQFLLLYDMREPIYLSDPASNLLRADRIFGRLR